jgi:phage gpG-like protein
MAKIKFDIDDRKVQDAFNRLIAFGVEPRLEMDAIGSVLKNRVLDCFDGSHNPEGNAWEPLKSRDVKPLLDSELPEIEAEVKKNGKPLIDSGVLRGSIDYQIDGNSVVVGTNKIQAALQNFGGTVVPKNKKALFFMVGTTKVFVQSVTIPAREFIPTKKLPDAWSDDIVAVLQKAIKNIVSA